MNPVIALVLADIRYRMCSYSLSLFKKEGNYRSLSYLDISGGIKCYEENHQSEKTELTYFM